LLPRYQWAVATDQAEVAMAEGQGQLYGLAPYPKFRNDHALPDIRIGAKEFNCIGVSPPDDHPHVYLNMGAADRIRCPYCGSLYHFDASLGPREAEPQDSVFADDTPVPLTGVS
jgi:uncharacterized Zn-finger protein